MERVDEQGQALGFSIIGVSRFQKDHPLEAELVSGKERGQGFSPPETKAPAIIPGTFASPVSKRGCLPFSIYRPIDCLAVSLQPEPSLRTWPIIFPRAAIGARVSFSTNPMANRI